MANTSLQSALDSEVRIAAQRFIDNGRSADVESLYTAIQRSNSSLKRMPKRNLQASIERVLDFMDVERADQEDSEAGIEQNQSRSYPASENLAADLLNRSLRANLAPKSAEANDAGLVATNPSANGSEPSRKRRMANGDMVLRREKLGKLTTEPPNDVSLGDIGGVDNILLRMVKLLVRPLLRPDLYVHLNVAIPNGVLLHGPPGCGKTLISRALAAAIGVPFIQILGPSIVSGMSGESEKLLRERFEEAEKNAPCLVFIDEIDAIAPKRDSSQSQMEKRIVAQLLVSMDGLNRDRSKPVIVLAATNRPDSIDPALRRGGRFDTEINIGVPNERMREQILRVQTRNSPLGQDVDFRELSKLTAGFVGSDLHDLISKAGSWQLDKLFEALETRLNSRGEIMELDSEETAAESLERFIRREKTTDLRIPAGLEDISIGMEAFRAVLPEIVPSSKREGFATIPDVSWDDIGALRSVREKLKAAIVDPIRQPELYTAVGINTPTGVLLWGPPGCGKTLLAKAVATESKANFISVKGSELLDKYVGESEAAVRKVFARARSSVPCVIFFDELDALVPHRKDSWSESTARVVNAVLSELDGLSDRQGIHVIAATNRPDIIDHAMLRAGRLETLVFVGLPGRAERVEILKTLLKHKPVDEIPEITELVRTDACDNYSGADLSALLREAGHHAISRKGTRLQLQDFKHAIQVVKASVRNKSDYDDLQIKFK